MKTTLHVLAAVLALLMLTVGMTACGDDGNDVVVVEPAASESTAPKSVIVTALKDGEKYETMNSSYLLAVCGTDTYWAELAMYEYTLNDDGAAVFIVDFGDGKQGTLTVTYDEETQILTTADVVYGDVTANLISEDWSALKPVLDALRNE